MRDSLVYWTTREPESDVCQHENGSRSESSCPPAFFFRMRPWAGILIIVRLSHHCLQSSCIRRGHQVAKIRKQ